jgi:hypothetical protein
MLVLSVFCLRLACGMLACLLLLSPRVIARHFFRTHFLTALGLSCLATVLILGWTDSSWLLIGLLVVADALAFAGSVVWSLEGAPGGRGLTVATPLTLGACLGLLSTPSFGLGFSGHVFADNLTSAALLGTAMTAMLIGHSYLIAPGMSLTPLFRLLAAFGSAAVLRMGVEGYDLWTWTAGRSFGNLGNDVLLWLPVRWVVGLLGPLILGAMAWQTARIRSTQSATGILYVVVICSFVGELTGLVLSQAILPFEG